MTTKHSRLRPEKCGLSSSTSTREQKTRTIHGDILASAVRRLGTLALLAAIGHVLFHYVPRLVFPAEVLQASNVPPASLVAMWAAVAASVVIFGLERTGKVSATLMLDLGLVYEVFGAFCIGVIDAGRLSSNTSAVVPGGIAFWITLFVLVVPNTLLKTVVAAVASAAMAPLALLLFGSTNNGRASEPYLLFLVSFPNLLAAGIVIVLFRAMYTLRADASKAHEMGSYKLTELLGRGGMGEVWRAEHRFLARPAAIKLIQPDALGCGDPRETAIIKQRFEREAQATALLSSPHTIHLYDFGVAEDGTFYYVMELLHGLDLKTLVERYGPVPAERAAHILYQLCQSLEEAHKGGLVHRDIKPANIYSCRYGTEYDFTKVLDFGIVKSNRKLSQQAEVTIADGTSGTPGFMSPEMALGMEVDARADIYAVGCVGYWLLTGKLVFEEDTFIATMLAHANKAPTVPSLRTEIEIPRQLEELIMRCLEKQPKDRPSSAGEIRRILSGHHLAESWTPDRAETWWKLHMPEKSPTGTANSAETAVQAHAEV